MTEILVSSGAFIGRANHCSPDGFFAAAGKIPCDGFEFMMYRPWYGGIDALLPRFLDEGRRFPTYHVEKTVGEKFSSGDPAERQEGFTLFRENCRIAKRLGSSLLVLHLWNGLPSDFRFESHRSAVGELMGIASEYGLTLTVENVICAASDPLTHFSELANLYPSLGFTFDTKMAAFHGQMEEQFYPLYRRWISEGRIIHLHLNDFGGEIGDFSNLRVLQIGEGRIAFSPFYRLIREVGYTGRITLECTCMQSDGTTDPTGLIRSLAKVRAGLSDIEKEG